MPAFLLPCERISCTTRTRLKPRITNEAKASYHNEAEASYYYEAYS
jgi:hypothetical protein